MTSCKKKKFQSMSNHFVVNQFKLVGDLMKPNLVTIIEFDSFYRFFHSFYIEFDHLVSQSLLYHLDMRFTITFTLILFLIYCTMGNGNKLELKNYISNENKDSYAVHSQPLNGTIRHDPNIKENLLSYMNADDSQQLSQPINEKSENNYLRAFTSALSRHKPTLNKNSLTAMKSNVKKIKQRKTKKKKLLKKIFRDDSSNKIGVPLEDTSRKKYLRLFNIGNVKSSLNDHSTAYVNDDTNYQIKQDKSELNLKKYFTSYSVNGVGDRQLYQHNSKLSLKKYPMPYNNEDDDSLNKELTSYRNRVSYHPLTLHVRSKDGLYKKFIKYNKFKKLKQSKVNKKKFSKKVSRVESSDELFDDMSTKNKLDLSNNGNNKASPNDYSTSYTNDDINYQLHKNKSELNLKNYLASYSVNKDGDHLLYQHNSKLSLKTMSNPNDHGDNYHPLKLHIRSEPNLYKYVMSRIKKNKKFKQRRLKKKKIRKKISRVKTSDEVREPVEDTSRKIKIYLLNFENNIPSPNDYLTSYVNDDSDYQFNNNESKINVKNQFASYSINGDGNHQLHQQNSTLSLNKYPISSYEDDHILKKDLVSYENEDIYHPLYLHIRTKPSVKKYLLSRIKKNHMKKLKQRKLKKRKSSKKIVREESSYELREPLKNIYLRLSNVGNTKPSSNNDSMFYENDINNQVYPNTSKNSPKNDSLSHLDGDDYKINHTNSKLNLKKNPISNMKGVNYQPFNQYIRSNPYTKKLHFKAYNKRQKQSRQKNKRYRQKIFRVDNRDEQPFRDLTRKKYIRLFKIGSSRPQPKNYFLIVPDHNDQNVIGKLQSQTHYDKLYDDYVIPNLKKYLVLLENAVFGNNILLKEADSPVHDDYHYDGQDKSLNLNLFLLNHVTDKDMPYYNIFSDIPKDSHEHNLNLKYQLLPRNKNKSNQRFKAGLKVDNMSYDKNRPIFNMNLISR